MGLDLFEISQVTEESEHTVLHGVTEQRRRAGRLHMNAGKDSQRAVTPVTALRAVWIEQRLAHKPVSIGAGL